MQRGVTCGGGAKDGEEERFDEEDATEVHLVEEEEEEAWSPTSPAEGVGVGGPQVVGAVDEDEGPPEVEAEEEVAFAQETLA